MLALMSVLNTLASMVPGVAPRLVGFRSPMLQHASALAQQLEADPSVVVQVVDKLTEDHTTVLQLLDAAAPTFTALTDTLTQLAEHLLHQAATLLPAALHPDGHAARAQLAGLGPIFMDAATQHLNHTLNTLAPTTATLWHIANTPPTQLTTQTEPTPPPAHTATPISHSSAGQRAVNAALTQLGTPYVWGGTTPGQGFDCSGLTQWAWRQAGIELPRLAQEQTIGKPVNQHDLIPGDLAVWDGHVAMYIGNGQIIEAGNPVQTNPIRTTNMGMTFKGFYRPTG